MADLRKRSLWGSAKSIGKPGAIARVLVTPGSYDDRVFAGVEDEGLVEVIDQMHGIANASMRALLAALVEIDQRETWRADGAFSTAMWLRMRHGLTEATSNT